MDEEIKRRLDAQDLMLQKIYKSAESTRKFLFWGSVVSILVIVVPMIGLVFAIPALMSSLSQYSSLLMKY